MKHGIISFYNTLPPLFSILIFLTCGGAKEMVKSKPISKGIPIICEVTSCDKELGLFQFDGLAFKKLQLVKPVGKDSFVFYVPETKNSFYYIGPEKGQKKSVLVGSDQSLSFEGDCENMRRAKVKDSPMNDQYAKLTRDFGQNKSNMNQIYRKLMGVKSDPEKIKKMEAQMAVIDERRLNLLDSLKRTAPFLAKIAALETFLSFPNNKGTYANDLEHYAGEYFRFVDLSDPDYNNIPYVFEAFKTYAQTLSSVKIPLEQHANYIDEILNTIPKDSRTYRYALGGVVTATQGKNHPNFLKYAKTFVELYEKEKVAGVMALKEKLKSAENFMPGGTAPDFTLPTPEGNDMKLSDLRGKVVLVDFWASWCGPCRRENPHVVQLYNKYKDKGFDVLGVSLDKKRDAWEKAIKKDGLEWHHVSDLRGWGNEVAKMYSVSSIPHTILLDQEGKIIARNFRSVELEEHLKEIFD